MTILNDISLASDFVNIKLCDATLKVDSIALTVFRKLNSSEIFNTIYNVSIESMGYYTKNPDSWVSDFSEESKHLYIHR